jgi:MerR family transcriptional regulator, thiopeptide resistance regulator
MSRQGTYQVSEVATLTGVSVRTLHHYDAIGLLVPKGRTVAGYRLYDAQDLLRLQQILIGREQGLSLEAIRASLDDPRFDRKQALLAHRQQLEQRAEQTHAMIRAIDAALNLLEGGSGAGIDMKQLFNGFDPSKYAAEAETRFGQTDSYKESMKRTKGYTPEDWQRMQNEQSAVYTAAFAVLQAGSAPESEAGMVAAERHRLFIERWFYPCSYAIHAGLADGYEQDPRFAENIDKYGAALTPFLAAAIRANAKRQSP